MTTQPADLRNRIVEVLWPLTDWDGDQLNAERAADAVLAMLPEPADRAAVWREAAETVRSMASEHPTNAAWVQDCRHIADRIDEAAVGRAADKPQPPATDRCTCRQAVHATHHTTPVPGCIWCATNAAKTQQDGARP